MLNKPIGEAQEAPLVVLARRAQPSVEDREGVLTDRHRVVVQPGRLHVDIAGDCGNPVVVEVVAKTAAPLQLLLFEHEVIPAKPGTLHVVDVAGVAERIEQVTQELAGKKRHAPKYGEGCSQAGFPGLITAVIGDAWYATPLPALQ